MYIYAFPVQQAIIATHSDIEEGNLFVTSFLITLVLAWLSCKVVEKPLLRFNSQLTRRYYKRRARQFIHLIAVCLVGARGDCVWGL
jgi:peptidoglycan/LPS O-acetylase OafA/YrhL